MRRTKIKLNTEELKVSDIILAGAVIKVREEPDFIGRSRRLTRIFIAS